MSEKLCLLTVHAHPDDEASKGAGTVARYHHEGVHTVLVSCTGGEEGTILNPAMDSPEIKADMGAARAAELDQAAAIIGYDEVVRLGYRDSGMAGSEANANPASFAAAPLGEAVGRLVAVIRRTRPQVIVTYPEEQTEYPHPDHIRVHEISMLAYEVAADPTQYPEAGEPWAVAKLYYTIFPRTRMRLMHEKFLELGLESPVSAERLERLMRDDDPITTSVSIVGYEEVRNDALRAHATQVDPTSSFWFGLPPEVARGIYPFDDYFLALSRIGDTDVKEDDLFDGVR